MAEPTKTPKPPPAPSLPAARAVTAPAEVLAIAPDIDWADPNGAPMKYDAWIAEAGLSSFNRAAFRAMVREGHVLDAKFTGQQWQRIYDAVISRPTR